jgi:hypothetical protein
MRSGHCALTWIWAIVCALAAPLEAGEAAAAVDWAINDTTIEACSCPMFCQCFFNTKPAAHHEHGKGETHFCRANLAHRINHGHYGTVKLDGAKFWEAGDLGGDFTKGFDWVVFHFDPAVTAEQRQAILEIYNKHVKPLDFRSLKVGDDAPIEWQAGKDRSIARLDGGRMAEVVLRRQPGMTDAPIVIQNLRYFGAARNDGFVLMPNEVEAYRLGDQQFEYRGTNGFMITYELTSKGVAAAAK